MRFTTSRFDAKTCTTTCRRRLSRGGDMAYLKHLSKREQRLERKALEYKASVIASHRESNADVRREREERRQKRIEKVKLERERLIAEVITLYNLGAREKQRQHQGRSTIVSVLTLFAKERRNDMGAQAIVDYMTANNFPKMEEFTVEAVTEILEWLKAEGFYNGIIADAQQSKTDNNN
jgi:hypothetical protein